jgi:hypothetical protein
MSELLEAILSEPKILISLAIAVPVGFVVGSWFGFMAGLVSFGASFATVLTLLLVRSWTKKR